MKRSLKKYISSKKTKLSTEKVVKQAKRIAEEMEKVEGVKEVALAGSIAKGVPLYSNLNYFVVIDSYSNKNMEEIRKKAGKGNSVIFITEKDLVKKAKKRKANILTKTFKQLEYGIDKNSKTEEITREIVEEKLPRLRAKATDPRLIQTLIPLTNSKKINEAKAKQKRKGVKNPIFQERGFEKTINEFLNNKIKEKEFKKAIREEPRAREYLYRFWSAEKNPRKKSQLRELIDKIKIIK